MKKSILISSVLFLFTCAASSQTIQGTVKAGSQPNSVIVAVKPSVLISASKVSTFYFSLAIPATTTPRPTVAILNNFNTAISYTLESTFNANPLVENISGTNYYVYNFLGDGAQTAGLEKDLVAGDNHMVEISFSGGPVGTAEVKIVNVANGGQTSNSYFNIYDRGADRTNTTAMFFGGTPVNNGGYDQTSYTGIGNISLPVKFLSFYAIKNGDNAKLNWTVESDDNNRYFDVERSTESRNFKPYVKVDAKANGKTINTYEIADYNLSKVGSPVIYYRIKQIDKNGEITFSNIRNLNADRNGPPASLYPNPVKNITRLVVDVDAPGKALVVIRDVNGKAVKQMNMQFAKGINQQDLHVADIASGEYMITILGEGYSHQLKMTKIN